MAHIRFSTEILRRLGEELNPNIDQGILELVKNAYDADAHTCTVDLTDAAVGGKIVIEDDGVGMSEDDILNGWLVLGRSRKKQTRLTKLQRVPAGNKGLGRLAALRMGDIAILESRRRNRPEVVVRLDWRKFDAAEMVDNVTVPVTKRLSSNETLQRGSRITIEGLQRRVGRSEVKRLTRSMILLADPFGESKVGFQPRLIAPGFDDLAELLESRYFGEAEYHLSATLHRGRASATVSDWRGNVMWRADHAEIRGPKQAESLFDTVDATFDFWAFIFNPTTFTARSASLAQVREWLRAFGGTHIYWNGLRVSPYGDPEDDWLGLNLSRVRSPEERPSTNNSIGRIAVTDRHGRLEQTTDRGEFVNNEAFANLRAFAVECLEWMASRRLDAAEKRRAATRKNEEKASSKTRDAVEREIQKAPNSGNLSSAFARYDRVRQQEADALRREIQLYRTLSTAGITAATFAHESQGNPMKVLIQATGALERRTKTLPDYDSKFRPPIEMLHQSIDSLGVLSSTTLRLVDGDKRRVGRVDLHETLRQVLHNFKPFLDGREVRLEEDIPREAAYLQGTEAAIESILTNLINNSLAAFESVQVSQRRLSVVARSEGFSWELRVADNGPGIADIRLRDIWLPGMSSRPGGTGLGLTIVRDATTDLSGEVEAIAEGALGGAEIVVRLPILGGQA
ncbi:sensor histidine kinase [Georgenia muralis]|uniref:histidine kinase n=1 Tax=Georgenia muralis TaxID=154117 RepID=A0A3N4YXW4_9MICO|nr:sensor histidine kinase [Georgenia muralis]RPF25999.1 histidine kinase/DNA gyrase B/HSP90-like ATPase [Georgenia muralis]